MLPLTNRYLCCLGLLFASSYQLSAADPSIAPTPLSPTLVAVPQNLLGLSHAKEVQQELDKVSGKPIDWEKLLGKVDAVWWPSRILPASQQRKVISEQELALMAELEIVGGATAVKRLRQIELQSQGGRILLRPEVIKFLKVEGKQSLGIAKIFAETDRLAAGLKPEKGVIDEAKLKEYRVAKEGETNAAIGLLTPAQIDRLRKALGDPIDTSTLQRIYPLAPELIDEGSWIGEARPTMQALRGKVVLVHFYAFQCHNCVANFRHYKRWDEKLRDKGVQVVGIQTPETAAEREPTKVIGAAQKEGFRFPVLIDLDKKNWDAWGNTMWPTVYVIDKQGYIRFWWQGELNWEGATVDQKIETLVEQLLRE